MASGFALRLGCVSSQTRDDSYRPKRTRSWEEFTSFSVGRRPLPPLAPPRLGRCRPLRPVRRRHHSLRGESSEGPILEPLGSVPCGGVSTKCLDEMSRETTCVQERRLTSNTLGRVLREAWCRCQAQLSPCGPPPIGACQKLACRRHKDSAAQVPNEPVPSRFEAAARRRSDIHAT